MIMKCRKCEQQIKRRSEACVFYRNVNGAGDSYGAQWYVLPYHKLCLMDGERRRNLVLPEDFGSIERKFGQFIIFVMVFFAALFGYGLWRGIEISMNILLIMLSLMASLILWPIANILILRKIRKLP